MKIVSQYQCEMCDEPMIKSDFEYCDICGDCLENGGDDE